MNTAKTVAPTNGVKVNEVVKSEKLTAIPPVPVAKKITEEVAELPPIEDRLHKLNVLFDLQKKHSKLLDSKKKLTDFEIAQNKENSSLEISDDEGNEFTTTNPLVIAGVVKLILQIVNDKSKELEAQIVF